MAATFTASSPPKPPPAFFFFDDDDDFGDFEFAPPPPPPPHPTTNLNHQRQPPLSATKGHSGVASDDEDEWGDFIEGNRSSSNPPPEPPMTQTKVWEKPKGALPLSIFGEVEEEEEGEEDPDPGNSTANVTKGSMPSSSEVTPAVRNVTLRDSEGGGIRDLIADLYGRDRKESDGGKGDGKEDFHDNGLEFKGAESDLSGGAGIQVLANGREHVRVQNMLSGDYDIKSENGHANSLSQLFSGSGYETDSTSMVMPEIEYSNLENSLNPNLTRRNISTSPPVKDIVFNSSSPGKSDPRFNLHGRGNEDLVTDLHSLNNKLDSHRDFNGSCSNGVISTRDSTIYNDDDDLDNWEFKDAISDVWNKQEAQAEVNKKDVENIHPEAGTVNQKKDDSVVPDLFFGAVSHVDPVLIACDDLEEKKIEHARNPSLSVPDVSPSTTGVPLPSSLPLRSNQLGAGSEIVRDLLGDLYCEANKNVLSNTASLNNGNDTDPGVSYFENDELDDSSWVFKGADMCSGESNSLEIQNNFVESTLSAATSRDQDPHSISNSPTVYLTDSHITTTGGNDSSAPWDFLFGGPDQSTSVDFVCEPTHSAIGISGSTCYVSSEDNLCVKGQGMKSTLLENKENVIEEKSTDRNEVLTKLEPEVLVDFYTNAKELSHLLVLQHVDDLKKAHKVAKLSGEEAKAVALHQEIQEACIYINSEVDSSENISVEHMSEDIRIEKLLEALQQPYIQAFEIEYFLSEKISLAKKYLTSAMHLFNHATLILRLFNAASWEDQKAYIVAWSKMISACAQELQLGAMIWARCLQANVHKQILSETQGCQYFIALGEIFRVTEILSVTSTLYKPWLLLNPDESNKLLIEVAECSKFWTSPGLEKAVEGIHNLADSKKKEKIKSLLDSINFVQSVGRSDLLNHVPHHGDSVCQLSLLPAEKLQEMELVEWCGKNYFLKLANLWANRISSDSPSLPCINVG